MGAICVQEFDDSRDAAFRITYRTLLRSSSLREPRYPLSRVICDCVSIKLKKTTLSHRLVIVNTYFVLITEDYTKEIVVSLCNNNDPSAGSPTDTLLRLLLPLNGAVWGNSHSEEHSLHLTKSFNR